MTIDQNNSKLTDEHIDQLYQLMTSHFEEYKDLLQNKWDEILSRTYESMTLFISAFNNAAIGMALVGLDGKWLKTNQALSDITGYSLQELHACNFQQITHPDDLKKDLDLLAQLVSGEIQNYQMEKRYIHHAGHQIWVLLSVSLVRNPDGTPGYFISQIQDIHQRKRMEIQLVKKQAMLEKAQAELIKLAMYDAVTGLANRHMFTARCNSILSMLCRDGGVFSLALISIDNFDVYRDAYGSLVGEHALQLTAGLLSAELSHWDLLARYSDNQFALLMTHRTQHACASLCERLRHAVEEAEYLESRITISMGCVTCEIAEQQHTLPTQYLLIQQAEQALRQAQKSGGNSAIHKDLSCQILMFDQFP